MPSVKKDDPNLALSMAKEAFEKFLENPTGRYIFQRFLLQEGSGDHYLAFYLEVEDFKKTNQTDSKVVHKICTMYLQDGAEKQLNINQEDRLAIIERVKKPKKTMFDEAQKYAFEVIFTDSYRRFVQKALQKKVQIELEKPGTERDAGEYQGLGDCFCITDPAQNENPIVAVSDRFVAVTGYSAADVLNRNCRFLQGKGTDREAIKRIGTALRSDKEVMELLLNYKKNGTPFWNLLYVCPLKDQNGKTIYFLGGQVDITKNINNESPLRKLLESGEAIISKTNALEKKRSVLSFFRRRSNASVMPGPGAEASIVNPNLDPESQKDVFFETYANFLVFSPDDRLGTIKFVSSKFSELTGFKNVVGKDLSFLKGPLTSHNAIKDLKQAIKQENAWSREIICYDVNRQPHLNHLYLTPLKDVNQKVLLFIAVMKWRVLEDTELEEAKWKAITEKGDSHEDCVIS